MKKKLISLITAAVMARGISVPAMAADAKLMEGKLVVVHTNDMHGYYENYRNVYRYCRSSGT